jgi:hypothetical protein
LFAEFTVGKRFDFESSFSELMTLLLEEAYLKENEGAFV